MARGGVFVAGVHELPVRGGGGRHSLQEPQSVRIGTHRLHTRTCYTYTFLVVGHAILVLENNVSSSVDSTSGEGLVP